MRKTFSISVVIPAYGPGPNLERVVAALARQTPPIAQIIVSHSGKDDPSARFNEMGNVTVLHCETRLYAGAARNRGLALANTEWVAFIDEDVIVEDGWQLALQKAIALGNADCIAGSIGFAETGGYWGMALWFAEFGSVHPYLAAHPAFAGASANIAIRKELLEAISGFPEEWPRAQDTVAQINLRKAGARILFDPALQGNHVNLPGLKRMISHLYVTGQFSARVRRLFPETPGALAERLPALSLGLWLARLVQTYLRVMIAQNGPIFSLLFYTPGIIVGLIAWNIGFFAESLGRSNSTTDLTRL